MACSKHALGFISCKLATTTLSDELVQVCGHGWLGFNYFIFLIPYVSSFLHLKLHRQAFIFVEKLKISSVAPP